MSALLDFGMLAEGYPFGDPPRVPHWSTRRDCPARGCKVTFHVEADGTWTIHAAMPCRNHAHAYRKNVAEVQS